MEYTIDYFIEKFTAIPEDKWCTEVYATETACCALGYCGMRGPMQTLEAHTLIDILLPVFKEHADSPLVFSNTVAVASINDGDRGLQKFGITPKQRILAALQLAKEKQ